MVVRRRETHRERWLKHYGMTVAEFDARLEGQQGQCAICRGTDHNGRNWCVDHDHATGKVRGILCAECNVMLGNAKDNPAILRAAARYLAR